MEYPTYPVNARDRGPLIEWITSALEGSGCRVIHRSPANYAPFRVTFETQTGERLGVVAYAFLANAKPTKNRPRDEHRFQVKYGSKDGRLHSIWQDSYGLYTTLFVGVNPGEGLFVGADPVLHSPTRFFISIEFKQAHVEVVQRTGWHAWERESRREESPVEVLVGGNASAFLRYIRFERESVGEDQGHRQLLAEKFADPTYATRVVPVATQPGHVVPPDRLHALAREFELSEMEVLDLIASARRLKMAVRGWVAEEHLVRQLRKVPGVEDCERLEEEGGPDVRLRYEGSRALTMECKNVLRQRYGDGTPRLDFQRMRASKGDPWSRYYAIDDFDIIAACLHSVTERWEFRYALPRDLERRVDRQDKIAPNVRIDARWRAQAAEVLRAAASG